MTPSPVSGLATGWMGPLPTQQFDLDMHHSTTGDHDSQNGYQTETNLQDGRRDVLERILTSNMLLDKCYEGRIHMHPIASHGKNMSYVE